MPDHQLPLDGYCDTRFESVRDALAAHLSDRGELGAAVAVAWNGRTVVDLWGGWQDEARCQPWSRDTLVCMQSTGKAVGAVCLLQQVDAGRVELDEPVARYWPEFSQAGKGRITVRQLLAQQAGLPYPDHAAADSAYDRAHIVHALERQAPAWTPGSQAGYHSFTIGYLIDELMRRLSGMSSDAYCRSRISGPLDADLYFALTESESQRCCHLYRPATDSLLSAATDPSSPIGRSYRAMPATEDFNSPAFRSWGIPNQAHGNARGLMRFYAALAGREGPGAAAPLLTPATLTEATREHWSAIDAVLGIPIRGALVFMRSSSTVPFDGDESTFGVPGSGGSIGFANPSRHLAFAFCTNRMKPIGQERMQRDLIAAVAESIT